MMRPTTTPHHARFLGKLCVVIARVDEGGKSYYRVTDGRQIFTLARSNSDAADTLPEEAA